MLTKKQKITYGSVAGVAFLAIIASLTLGGTLFKGFLLQPLTLPDYVSCAFQQGTKITKIECPKFDVQNMDEGSYDVLVTYGNKNLGDQGKSIVPIKIATMNGTKDFVCEYADQGYVPELSIAGTSALDTDKILTKGQKITMGSLTQNLKINMKKDGKTYPYDVNICGAYLTGTVTKDGQTLGKVQYGFNGLINKSGINQIAIAPKDFYYSQGVSTQKPNLPGSYELTLDGLNSASFVFSVPCSAAKTDVKIENTESDSAADSALIPTTGLTDDYVKECSNNLYMSIHNTKDSSDVHTLSASLSKLGGSYALIPNMYDLKNILSAKNVSFPMTYTTYLHEKDGGGATEVQNLAQFTWTITGTNPSDQLPADPNAGITGLNGPQSPADATEGIAPADLGAPTTDTTTAAPQFKFIPAIRQDTTSSTTTSPTNTATNTSTSSSITQTTAASDTAPTISATTTDSETKVKRPASTDTAPAAVQ